MKNSKPINLTERLFKNDGHNGRPSRPRPESMSTQPQNNTSQSNKK